MHVFTTLLAATFLGLVPVAQASPIVGASSVQVTVGGANQTFQTALGSTWAFAGNEPTKGELLFDQFFSLATVGDVDAAEVTAAKLITVWQNRCAFWAGTDLQPATITLGSRTLLATPLVVTPPARTGYTATLHQPGGSLQIEVDATVLAQSVWRRVSGAEKGNAWRDRYSFRLSDTAGIARLTMLTLEVIDESDQVIAQANVGVTLSDAHDPLYSSNAGNAGHPLAVGALIDHEATSVILLSDSFRGNDDEIAQQAMTPPVAFSVPNVAGSWRIRIRGVVAADDHTPEQSFEWTEPLVDISPCQDLTPAPVISNFRVITIGPDSVTFAWETDQPATSQIVYRLSSGTDETVTPHAGAFSLEHLLVVTGLTANTDYVMRARSTSTSGLSTDGPPRTIRTRR